MDKLRLPKPGTVEVAPSILSADFAKLAGEIAEVESAGIKILHLDIMDGHFVPNITIGPGVVAKLRKHSKLVFDAHLMVTDPAKYAPEFIKAGANHITFHIEAVAEPMDLINKLHDLGVTVGLCLNPETSVDKIRDFVRFCDMILIMTVHPGFGGQKFIAEAAAKIGPLREIAGPDIRVEIDGGIDTETAGPVVADGADTLVVGHAIFARCDRVKAINDIRDACA